MVKKVWLIRQSNHDGLWALHFAVPWKSGKRSGWRLCDPKPEHVGFNTRQDAADYLRHYSRRMALARENA